MLSLFAAVLLSLSSAEAQTPALCEEVGVELWSAVESELISEKEYKMLLGNCYDWIERQRDRQSK